MGYDFASSFEEDHTDFDEKKVLEIKEGTTTQQEVLEFLGAPNGRQIYPMTEMKDEVAFLYSYGHWKPGSGQYRKNVVVSIAPDGIVRKVSFSSSGIR
jgi:hypothetical protein